jgi:Reverse transcriptase (RNA-dependent DNA polymerase)
VVEVNLWPMAVSYSVWLYNHIPRNTGIAPIDAVSKVKHHGELARTHVFGCPVYVLDPKLQDGQKIPKFKPRSRRGMFVGFSRHHSSIVPLILNLSTLSITPQYHVIFDDWFTSISNSGEIDPTNPIWDVLFSSSRYRYIFDENDDVSLNDEWNLESDYAVRDNLLRDMVLPRQRENNDDDEVIPTTVVANDTVANDTVSPRSVPSSPITITVPTTSPMTIKQEQLTPTVIELDATVSSPPSQPTSSVRRTTRTSKAPTRYGYDGTQQGGYTVEVYNGIVSQREQLVQFHKNISTNKYVNNKIVYLAGCFTDYDNGTVDYPDPVVYAAASRRDDPDTLQYHQAIREPDWEQFRQAALLEIRTLERMGTWQEVLRSSVPSGHRVLGGTWVFKRKRDPTGLITRHRARYCVRGDQQVAGVDYFESYAPVVAWPSVRMMFILAILTGMVLVSVDYTNAFAQATLNETVYVAIPMGFEREGYVLKLLRSLYGLVQAPRTFYEYLSDNLRAFGFVNHKSIDGCLWINDKLGMICLVYVDDCLFFAKEKETIMTLLDAMEKIMPLTMSNEADAFLGIRIERKEKKFELTQPGLIDQVINYTGMKDCNLSHTPAVPQPLGSDVQGDKFDETWSYASAVGMLMYLSNNTRPDIAFATHQCARFTHAPKKSHALAVKRIIRYLQGTKDKGMILQPSNSFTVDCYVDADFAGLYGYEDDQDPVCAKSRSGFVMYLADCPLIWGSKLQTEVASSTMEAEYIALATAMRELIPLRRLVKLACDTIMGSGNYDTKMFSSVFEDNNGALQLARAPRMTPRTKHYGIKYHFFGTYVEKEEIKLFKIGTKEQRADIMTKGLVMATFQHLRKYLVGW